MCIICIEIAKNSMSLSEAEKNLKELIGTEQTDEEFNHHSDLLDSIENNDLDELSVILDEQD